MCRERAQPSRCSLGLRGATALTCTFEHHVAREVAGRSLTSRMERHEERDQRRGLRGREVLPVRGHVAAALDDLADELVLGEAHGHVVQRGPALAPAIVERMAVAALLHLEDEGAL